ncbi:hypothetical protein [Variovorax sp. LT1R16]|uniref:hypothetical protein n=1 Tax=Variovorax sp. LT1R16 TaxID=3443728 RepID=UPI003F44D68C
MSTKVRGDEHALLLVEIQDWFARRISSTLPMHLAAAKTSEMQSLRSSSAEITTRLQQDAEAEHVNSAFLCSSDWYW